MGREMRWWGWGEDAHAGSLPDAGLAWLEGELGGLDAPRGPVALEDVRMETRSCPAPSASASARSCATTAPRACSTPAASPIPTSCASAPATARARLTPC